MFFQLYSKLLRATSKHGDEMIVNISKKVNLTTLGVTDLVYKRFIGHFCVEKVAIINCCANFVQFSKVVYSIFGEIPLYAATAIFSLDCVPALPYDCAQVQCYRKCRAFSKTTQKVLIRFYKCITQS